MEEELTFWVANQLDRAQPVVVLAGTADNVWLVLADIAVAAARLSEAREFA